MIIALAIVVGFLLAILDMWHLTIAVIGLFFLYDFFGLFGIVLIIVSFAGFALGKNLVERRVAP
jgi:hypothetical protein